MSVYDSIGQNHSNPRLPDPRIVDFILKLLQLKPGSAIADIGAGTGGYSKSLANYGYQLYAIELIPSNAIAMSATSTSAMVYWMC